MSIELPEDRYLKFHRRQWTIYLMGCTAMAIGTMASVLDPADEPPSWVLLPIGLFFGLMILLAVVARLRYREEFARERKRILSDEWMAQGLRRATGRAFLIVMLAQAPLMFFMADVPQNPSVAGMGGMTVALGCAAMAALYLYYTRAGRDNE
jgi:uncharacterized membrane protein